MNAQTLVKTTIFSLITALTSRYTVKEPVCALSCDYGFDYNEAELATELCAPLPEPIARMGMAEVSAEEVEASNLYLF